MSNSKPYRSPAQLVAEACSANPVALLIPCHRVIRSDGAIGGYRWRVNRKRALLAREASSLLSLQDHCPASQAGQD